jgi:hypothetical protein
MQLSCNTAAHNHTQALHCCAYTRTWTILALHSMRSFALCSAFHPALQHNAECRVGQLNPISFAAVVVCELCRCRSCDRCPRAPAPQAKLLSLDGRYTNEEVRSTPR